MLQEQNSLFCENRSLSCGNTINNALLKGLSSGNEICSFSKLIEILLAQHMDFDTSRSFVCTIYEDPFTPTPNHCFKLAKSFFVNDKNAIFFLPPSLFFSTFALLFPVISECTSDLPSLLPPCSHTLPPSQNCIGEKIEPEQQIQNREAGKLSREGR